MTAGTCTLPVELAPALRDRAEQLIAECGLTSHPVGADGRGDRHAPTCARCYGPGRLVAHYRGDVVLQVHRSCRRRLRAAGR